MRRHFRAFIAALSVLPSIFSNNYRSGVAYLKVERDTKKLDKELTAIKAQLLKHGYDSKGVF